MILRKGYTKRLNNKTIKVKSRCIAAQSASGLKRTTINAHLLKKMRQKCKRNNTKYKTHHKCIISFRKRNIIQVWI